VFSFFFLFLFSGSCIVLSSEPRPFMSRCYSCLAPCPKSCSFLNT
jgi:hypothetical protein